MADEKAPLEYPNTHPTPYSRESIVGEELRQGTVTHPTGPANVRPIPATGNRE